WFVAELKAEAARPLTQKEKEDVGSWGPEFEEVKKNVKKLVDSGVLLAAGTDAPYPGIFQGESIHHELELLVSAGLTPLQAIHAATYNAARIMKAENDWGSLQAGKLANVIVVSGNPAEQISDTRNIEIVVLEGRVLDRQSLRFDAGR